MQVAGVAGEEDAALTVSLGDQAVRRPGIGDQDLHLDLAADRLVDDGARLGGIGRCLAAGQRHHEIPGVAAIHRPHHRRRIGIDQPVHDRGLLRVQAAEVRAAQHQIEILRVGVLARHRYVEELAHEAAGAVGSDHVAGADRRRGTGGGAHDLGLDAVSGLLDGGEPGGEAQIDRGQRQHVIAQHRLHFVLRDPLRGLGEVVVFHSGAIERVLDPRQGMPAEPGREDDIGGIGGRQRRGPADALGDAPAPHVLHRAHVGGLGARLMADALVLLDDDGADAAPSQLDRGGEAHRPGADDQHLGGIGRGYHRRVRLYVAVRPARSADA